MTSAFFHLRGCRNASAWIGCPFSFSCMSVDQPGMCMRMLFRFLAFLMVSVTLPSQG